MLQQRKRFLPHFLYCFCLIVAVALTAAIRSSAQNTTTGAFQGQVSDTRTQLPIQGALIRITSEQTGLSVDLTTDSKGLFFRGLLPEGWYELKITASGFLDQRLRREIRIVGTSNIVPVPVSMVAGVNPPVAPPTQPADSVRVLMNTVDARHAGSFRDIELISAPIGGSTVSRSFDEVASLIPGVAPPPQPIGAVSGPGVGPGVGSAGQFAVNGLRSRANNFTVDGSDNNDEDIGVRRQGFVALVPQSIESVSEFSIQTLLAPAQFGRNIGAQVNAVSRSGGKDVKGSFYGHFNSSRMNARAAFDSARGDETTLYRASGGQTVLLDGTPITVQNQSGGESPLTVGQFGATLGGPLFNRGLFYFLSAEHHRINAVAETNFAVPTIEQRGLFSSGDRGLSVNPFTGTPLQSPFWPGAGVSNTIFSLIPLPNDPAGVYGTNTFTQTLPANARGTILSGRMDQNFAMGSGKHSVTGRYNFTDDKRDIPAVGDAIFASVTAKTRTNNLSLFLNSGFGTAGRLFNQLRVSYGYTQLGFDEIRDEQFLVPSSELPNEPFLLNSRFYFNGTLPQNGGQARLFTVGNATSEDVNGPVGQINIGGYSPIGTDVYNFPQLRTNKTFQIADDLTRRVGKHTIVLGADIRATGLVSDLPRNSRTLLTFNGSPRLFSRPIAGCPDGGIEELCFVPRTDPRPILLPTDLVALGSASNSLLTLNVDRPDARADLIYHQLNFFTQDTWRVSKFLSLSFGLRYEYNTPLRERGRLIEDTFTDARLAAVPVLQTILGGRTALYKPDRNNLAPRVGAAYSRQFFGESRVTVFRAGYGLYYDQILGAVANQSRNVFPTFLTVNLAGLAGFTGQFLTIDNPTRAVIGVATLRRPGTLNAFNLAGYAAGGTSFTEFVSGLIRTLPNALSVTLPADRLEMPEAHHVSLSAEQQLSKRYTLSASYVSTIGRKLLRFTTPNLGPSLTTVPTSVVPNPVNPQSPLTTGLIYIPKRPFDTVDSFGEPLSFGAVNQFETTAPSSYHALETQLRARYLESLDLRVSYVFSKAIDEVSDVFDLAGAFALPQNSFEMAAERAVANFDVPHRFTYDLRYTVGSKGSGTFRKLARGMTIAATGRLRSGQPYTVNSVIDVNLDGNTTDRLDSLTGIQVTGDRAQPLRLTTANLVSLLAPFGTAGRIGRNTFRSGSVIELDLSVIKPFRLGGDRRLDLRADIFNFLNRANYGIPVRLLESPGFGRAVNTVTPSRRLQISVKLNF